MLTTNVKLGHKMSVSHWFTKLGLGRYVNGPFPIMFKVAHTNPFPIKVTSDKKLN